MTLPLLLLALLLQTTRPSNDMNPTGPFDMARFRWQNRPLLVFAPGEADQLARQRTLLNDATAGLIDRDMVVIEVLGPDSGHVLNPVDGSRERLTADDVKQLRLAYNVTLDRFAVVLVGKDGTEKRRETDVVDPAAVFEQIDAMPMRKDEMRKGLGSVPQPDPRGLPASAGSPTAR